MGVRTLKVMVATFNEALVMGVALPVPILAERVTSPLLLLNLVEGYEVKPLPLIGFTLNTSNLVESYLMVASIPKMAWPAVLTTTLVLNVEPTVCGLAGWGGEKERLAETVGSPVIEAEERSDCLRCTSWTPK